jgi:hypothetical protein
LGSWNGSDRRTSLPIWHAIIAIMAEIRYMLQLWLFLRKQKRPPMSGDP